MQLPVPASGSGSGPGTFPAALPGERSVAVCRCWHCGCHKTLLFVLDQSCGCYHAECHKTCIALHAIDNGNDSANSNNNNKSGHNNCDDNVDAAVGKCLLNLRPALTSSASTSASASALRQRWVCAASTVAPDRITAASKLGALALTTLAANESPKINMPFSSRLGCKSIWELIGGHMTKPLSTLTGGQLGHFIDSGSSHHVGAYHAIQLQLPIVARTLDRVTRELCV